MADACRERKPVFCSPGLPRLLLPASWDLGSRLHTELLAQVVRRCDSAAFHEELNPSHLPPGWDRQRAVRGGTEAGREGGAERAGGAAGGARTRPRLGVRTERVGSPHSLQKCTCRFFPRCWSGSSGPRGCRGRVTHKRIYSR